MQRLNRRIAIVIDSDNRRSKQPLNATKKRVLDEIEKTGGIGWVTAGREIENYVSTANMRSHLTAVHPSTGFKEAKTQWDCCYEAERNKTFSADKVAIARVAAKTIKLDVLDLRSKVEGLVEFIRAANR